MFDGDPENVQAIVVGMDIYDACKTPSRSVSGGALPR
jgi:hypothetical protein